MAASMASLSRRLSRSLFSLPKPSQSCLHFSTISDTTAELFDAELDVDGPKNEANESPDFNSRPLNFQRPLEKGLDQGVYKAILIGRVGQKPVQKRLKSGTLITLFSVGTGGIRNNRRPLDDEDPREYANRCSIQWHRVTVYPEKLGELAMKHVKSGSILYLEGNLETKVFSDQITGLVRRIREVAVRRDGRLLFLGKADEGEQAGQIELTSVGYF